MIRAFRQEAPAISPELRNARRRNHPAGYYWINFFLHAANVLLVLALALRLFAGRSCAVWIAFIIAMLWAAHPVLKDSVTNIIGRADLLAGFAVAYSDCPAMQPG